MDHASCMVHWLAARVDSIWYYVVQFSSIWAPERRPSNLRKGRLPRKVVSRQNQLHSYTQRASVSHNQVSAKRESLLAGFLAKTQPRAERFGRGGCDSRDASDELGRSGRWLRNFVAFQMERSNGQGVGTCLGPVIFCRKEDEDEGRAGVLVRRSAATSALGRSAAVRERLLLRWSAEQSSEMTTST